jgi:hypothetical protein
MKPGTATDSPASQLRILLRRFDPIIRELVRDARAGLRRRLPTAIELVYSNAKALAIGFASSDRRTDIIVSLAVYARGVNLYFLYRLGLGTSRCVSLSPCKAGSSAHEETPRQAAISWC